MSVADRESILLTTMGTKSFENLNGMSSNHTEIAGIAVETAITACDMGIYLLCHVPSAT